jgi:hypothetical protein
MTFLLGSTITINALQTAEMSVTIYQSKRRNNREDLNRHQRGCDDNSSYMLVCLLELAT